MQNENRVIEQGILPLVQLDKEIRVEAICTIIENKDYQLQIAKCYKKVMAEFDEFARRVGTLFGPAELLIQRSAIGIQEPSEYRCEISLLNRRTYRYTGLEILCLLIMMFDAAIKEREKTDDSWYQEFKLHCRALTYYRDQSLTPLETNAVEKLVRSCNKSLKIEHINATFQVANPIQFPEELLHSDFPINGSKAEEEISAEKKYRHIYSPFEYELYFIHFKSDPSAVKINNKTYYVWLPEDFLEKIKKVMGEYLGEQVVLKKLGKKRKDEHFYSVISVFCFDEDHCDEDVHLQKYSFKELSFSNAPSVLLDAERKTYYVYFPDPLIRQVKTYIKNYLGPTIRLEERNDYYQAKRCHQLVGSR